MALLATKNQLETLLTKNQVTLKNLYELKQDMGTLLDASSTIYYKDCEDIKLKIDSKVNRLIFDQCKNIVVELCGVISGIEIKKSCGISINIKRKFPLNSILIEKSKYISLSLSKKSHNDTFYQIDKSHGIMVMDHKNKALYLKN